MNRKYIVITAILLFKAFYSLAQSSSLANRYLDTAVAYQRTVKNYLIALKYYDLAIKEGNDGNYTYYNAAQCACQAGQTEKAIDYYKKGFAKFMDYNNYEYFATDTLIKCFSNTPDWKHYLSIMKPKYDSAQVVRANYLKSIHDSTKRMNSALLSDPIKIVKFLKNKSAQQTIAWIKNYNGFPNPPVKSHSTLYQIKVNDSLIVPFLVYIPKSYNPAKKNKLFVFLHGAVSQRPAFYSAPMSPDDQHRKALQKPIDDGAIIIYPLAKKGFNWLYNLSAFETILKEISFVKSIYNIDDNKIFLGGHSDGGIGTFWMATHKSYPFAGFLGLNYFPMSYFNNTCLANLKNNTPFYGISARDDGTFNIASVTNIKNYGLSIGDNWHSFTLPGEHGMPFDEPGSISFAYDSLFNHIRKPFPKHIEWETDDVKNGRAYWLEITQLDTLQNKATWHKEYNPPATQINARTAKYNFNPHKSGAITATWHGNTIAVHVSRVKAFTIYVSPEMIDLNKPLTITVNGNTVWTKKVVIDKETIVDEFIKTKDRDLIIVKKIKVELE